MSHDPAKEFVTEKTTGRKLNILDVPGGKSDSKAPSTTARPSLGVQTSNMPKTTSSRHSREVPTGRALSPGKIAHPKPSKPYASLGLRQADYDVSPIDDLEERFAGTRLSDHGRNYSSSPSELSDSSASSGTAFSASSPGSASPSSASSLGGCRCERYGVTRDGRRVKLDCGGKRCGYGDSSSSECASSADGSEEDSSEDERDRRARMRKEAERRPVARQPVKGKSGGEERRKTVVVERRRR